MLTGKLSGTFLVGDKKSTRTFDYLSGREEFLNQTNAKAFLVAYKNLLATGSANVSGRITFYETEEVDFD